MKKQLLFILFAPLLLASCSNEYEVEDALYEHIENKYAQHSYDLESTLDSLEQFYIEEGLIKSGAPKDLRNYFQQNIDEGQLRYSQSYEARALLGRVPLSYPELEKVALRKVNGETFDASKFGLISNRIEKNVTETGQIASSNVAMPHLNVLSAEDFEHPYYRANVLLFLHTLYYPYYVQDQKYIREIPTKIEYVPE